MHMAGASGFSADPHRKLRKLTTLLLEDRQRRLEAGEAWALLDAVDLCARSGTPMPVWLVDAFGDRYMKWHLYQVRTLDEAFEVAGNRKGMQIEARAHREWLKPRIVFEVFRLHDGEGMPFDDALFERAGQTLGIGKTVAKEIYYDPENHWRELLPRSLQTSR
jgi:hypothetical protein